MPVWRSLGLADGWDVPHVGVGVVTATGDRATHGDPDRAFALASVTKPLFSYAVLVAVEEGSLSLDEPCGPPGSTVRHLLAHASGLAPDEARVLTAPGRTRIYSNAGFDVLGARLADATGFTAAEYLHDAVCAPLGMAATALHGSPAHGAVASTTDLLRFGAELLRPSLVSPRTLREATTVQFPGLSGVLPGFGRQDDNGWGLGFEVRGTKQPHWTAPDAAPATFGHFGRSGTFLWVDPARGVACVALTDREFGPWAAAAWPPFSSAVLAEADGR